MDLHVFPIPIPPTTSLSIRSLWVFPVHQVRAPVSCIQPGLHHTFFIHSSVEGHFGCFHVLVIVNSAAVNIGVQVSLQIIALFGFMPRSGTAESYGYSIFSLFEELPHCFPQWLCQFTCRSLFSTSSPAFVICRHFNNGYSDWCKLVPPHSFDLHVSNN